MKKIIVVLLFLVIGFSAIAEDDWKHNRNKAIHLNPFPFFPGSSEVGFGSSIGFEYAPNRQFAVKTNLHYLALSPGDLFWRIEDANSYIHSLRFQVESRWYPLSHYIHGIFVNGGLQYQWVYGSFVVVTEIWDDEAKKYVVDSRTPFNGTNSAGYYVGFGNKWIFGNNRFALLIEPALEYVYSIHFDSSPQFDLFHGRMTLGMHGTRLIVNFGVAF